MVCTLLIMVLWHSIEVVCDEKYEGKSSIIKLFSLSAKDKQHIE